MTRDEAIELVAHVLEREGGSPGNSLHNWRCEYQEKCDCLEQVADEIVTALVGAGVVL